MSKQEVEDILLVLDEKEKEIQQFFSDPKSPNIYIDYETYLKNFKLSEANFLEQNLNIIDVHLRYRWWVREQMSVYKWTPIILLTPFIFRNAFALALVPWAAVKLFDHYFERYFLWKYRNERIINVRNEFITKLSKSKNKIRRIALFDAIEKNLVPREQQKEPPIKYIKFGQFTEYVFHAFNEGKEQSSILQTTFFERYLGFKNILWDLFQLGWWKSMVEFRKNFVLFRRDPERNNYKINLDAILDRPDVKPTQVYSIEDNINDNVRRWSELFRFITQNSLEPSEFKIWEHTSFTRYYDIFQPLRFNYRDNGSDLAVYYALVSIPKLFNIIFKRR